MAPARSGRAARLAGVAVLGLAAAGWGGHALADARLRGAFREALAARAPMPATAPGGANGGAGTGTALRVALVSYNVWALPLPLPGLDRRARLPRIPAALAGTGPDVILLQEAFDVRMRAFLADYFADWNQGPGMRCRERMGLAGEKDCTGGLVTLSRFPVAAQRFWVHPTGKAPKFDERNGRKGFLLSTLETPVGPVDVVNIHLYAGRTEADEDHRLLQLAQLRAVLDSTGGAGRPVILAGDLNVVHPSLSASDASRTPSRAYRFLLDSLRFADTHPHASEADLTYDAERNPYAGLRYNRFEGRQVFDYVMVRVPPGVGFRLLERRRILDGERPLSDHYGTYAVLELWREAG